MPEVGWQGLANRARLSCNKLFAGSYMISICCSSVSEVLMVRLVYQQQCIAISLKGPLLGLETHSFLVKDLQGREKA